MKRDPQQSCRQAYLHFTRAARKTAEPSESAALAKGLDTAKHVYIAESWRVFREDVLGLKDQSKPWREEMKHRNDRPFDSVNLTPNQQKLFQRMQKETESRPTSGKPLPASEFIERAEEAMALLKQWPKHERRPLSAARIYAMRNAKQPHHRINR
jgi:hypothetical protein